MLNLRHSSTKGLSAWRNAWKETGNIRIEEAFDEEALLPVLEAMSTQTFTLAHSAAPHPEHHYWKSIVDRHWDPFQPYTTLWAWLNGEGLEWFEAVTDRALHSPQPKSVSADLYTQDCFLNRAQCNDRPGTVVFVIGLTSTTWPAEQGGHLHFTSHNNTPSLIRSPAYNTLDIFDSGALTYRPEVPKLTHPARRYTVSGWLHPRQL